VSAILNPSRRDVATRQTLSVVIPTKNVAELMRDCLASVEWADEIIVVDMFSDDEIEDVCARYPQCRLIRRDDYIYGNVNYGFDLATTDWVLRLDSDERVTPELRDEILAMLTSPPEGVVGFALWERFHVLGRELHHGKGRKSFRNALFRRGAARYALRHEHEQVEGDGTWLRLEHPYLHFTYPRVRDYLAKTNYYTDKDVERFEFTRKPPNRDAVIEPLRAFYLYYIKRTGFRDGWPGFVDAAMRSVYQIVQWAKLRERWEREHSA
jgi:glycosyltransferase involved in cell wall biosynthesis